MKLKVTELAYKSISDFGVWWNFHDGTRSKAAYWTGSTLSSEADAVKGVETPKESDETNIDAMIVAAAYYDAKGYSVELVA